MFPLKLSIVILIFSLVGLGNKEIDWYFSIIERLGPPEQEIIPVFFNENLLFG